MRGFGWNAYAPRGDVIAAERRCRMAIRTSAAQNVRSNIAQQSACGAGVRPIVKRVGHENAHFIDVNLLNCNGGCASGTGINGQHLIGNFPEQKEKYGAKSQKQNER